jgi:hypothetical protein
MFWWNRFHAVFFSCRPLLSLRSTTTTDIAASCRPAGWSHAAEGLGNRSSW